MVIGNANERHPRYFQKIPSLKKKYLRISMFSSISDAILYLSPMSFLFKYRKKKIEYISGSQAISRRLGFGKHSELITMSLILDTVVAILDNTTLNQAFYRNKKRTNSGILYV